MYRIDVPTAVGSIPTPAVAGTAGYFTDGDPSTGSPATIVDADWLNLIQEEIMSVLAAASVSPSKTTRNQLLTSIQTLIGAPRIRLTTTTNYYVSPSGNDSNPGSSGSPWLTIQHAINYLASTIDLGGQSVNINLATGTYTGGLTVNAPFTGQGSVTILGNPTTPSNCLISTTSADCIFVAGGASLNVSGLKLQTTTSGSGLHTVNNGTITITGKMEFGACANYHIEQESSGAVALSTAAYTISGGALAHFFSNTNASIQGGAITITLTGTPAFGTAFAYTRLSGTQDFPALTFSGGATGMRYFCDLGGGINTSGGGVNYFPGTIAGDHTNGFYA